MTKDLYFMAYKIIPNWVVYWSLLLTAFMHTFAPTFWKSRTGGSKNWWVIRKIYIYIDSCEISLQRAIFPIFQSIGSYLWGPFVTKKHWRWRCLNIPISITLRFELPNVIGYFARIDICIYIITFDLPLSLSLSLYCVYIYIYICSKKKEDDRFGKGKLF